MIAIGFTDWSVRVPAPLQSIDAGSVAVLMIPPEMAGTAQDRLARQLDAWRGLDSFVPLAARALVSGASGQRLARAHGGSLSLKLHRVRSCGQISLFAEPDAPQRQAMGASWLRQRAAAQHAREALGASLSDLVKARGWVTDAQNIRLKPQDHRVVLHLLVPKPDMRATERAMSHHLEAPDPQTQGWRFTVSAGWPPYAFCDDLMLEAMAA